MLLLLYMNISKIKTSKSKYTTARKGSEPTFYELLRRAVTTSVQDVQKKSKKEDDQT